MSEYLVSIHIRLPYNMDEAKKKALYEAEAEHCRSDAVAPFLKRLWRIPGTTDNKGLWEADDINDLHTAIAGFPLFPYMKVTILALATNLNDPALRQHSDLVTDSQVEHVKQWARLHEVPFLPDLHRS